MKITILGCGSSWGVPQIGCACAVCTSSNPRNKRTRVSVYVEHSGACFLIDSSPDLYQQALACGVTRVDAVLYTHDHADHMMGITDLRAFNLLQNKTIPIYGMQETIASLTAEFAYAFLPKPDGNAWYRPSLQAHIIPRAAKKAIDIKGISITCFEQAHAGIRTLGYRIGDFAYSTDVNKLPESAFEALEGVKVWIVDCLRYTASHTHSTLSNTLEWIARVKPELAVLTHMAHDFDYDTLRRELPAGVVPGHDGMQIEL